MTLTRKEAWTVALVATLVMTVSYVDRQTFAALAPTVRAELGIDHTQYGFLTAAFSLAYLVGAPVSGALIDRIGARRGLVFAVLAWSCVSGLHALAPSFAILFALRIALGVTEAPSFPGAAQAVRRALPKRDRSAGFGLLFTGSSIGAMFAAPLAIAFKIHFGWRFAFIGTAIVALAWVPAWLWVSTGVRARSALAQVDADGPDRSSTPAPARAAATLIREPAVQRAVVLVLASAPAVNFALNWLPQYLVSAQGLTQDTVGRYVAVPAVFFDLGAVGFGAAASLIETGKLTLGGPRPPPSSAPKSHPGLVALAAAASSCLALVAWAPSPFSATILVAISMMGGGALYALLTADMLARVDATLVAAAGGIAAGAQSLAYIVSNPLVGRAVDATHSYQGPLLVLGAIAVPGAIAWIAWPLAKRDA